MARLFAPCVEVLSLRRRRILLLIVCKYNEKQSNFNGGWKLFLKTLEFKALVSRRAFMLRLDIRR